MLQIFFLKHQQIQYVEENPKHFWKVMIEMSCDQNIIKHNLKQILSNWPPPSTPTKLILHICIKHSFRIVSSLKAP